MPTRARRAKSLGIPVDQLPDGRGKHDNHARGENAARWNQGVIVSSEGYRKIRVGTSHPLADPNGYTYEHLLVWCGAGNPRPLVSEILHHKNENKADNRIENLELLTRRQHNQIHNAERGRDARGRLLPSKASGNLLDGKTWMQFPDEEKK